VDLIAGADHLDLAEFVAGGISLGATRRST
jgi:hypothetical protein